MADRRRSPLIEFGPLIELEGKYAAKLDASRKRVFDEWNRRLGDRMPTSRELRFHCKFLLNRPHLIEGPYAPSIFLILQLWFKKTPPPKRPDPAAQIGELVDWVIDTEKIQPGIARQKVADAFKMTVEAVKQAHIRYRRAMRDKSR
jgi:hypothetical protein